MVAMTRSTPAWWCTALILLADPIASLVPDHACGPQICTKLQAVPFEASSSVSRRHAVVGLTQLGTFLGLCTSSSRPANAFANKISNAYDDRPKRRGPQPKDLGVSTRTTLEGDEYVGLKACGAAPNCFSSSIPLEDDPDHSIPSWTYPSSYDQTRAFDELQAVIQAYQPGQNGVDGGGFVVQTFDAKRGYLYTQFEALKNGYIDDFEAAVVVNPSDSPTKAIQVRSSSRVGYLDYGVNSKRLNYIANELRRRGWDAAGVDFQTHRGYAMENNLK